VVTREASLCARRAATEDTNRYRAWYTPPVASICYLVRLRGRATISRSGRGDRSTRLHKQRTLADGFHRDLVVALIAPAEAAVFGQARQRGPQRGAAEHRRLGPCRGRRL
jgi:hypothetical protein